MHPPEAITLQSVVQLLHFVSHFIYFFTPALMQVSCFCLGVRELLFTTTVFLLSPSFLFCQSVNFVQSFATILTCFRSYQSQMSVIRFYIYQLLVILIYPASTLFFLNKFP